jgi:hypothetical protein
LLFVNHILCFELGMFRFHSLFDLSRLLCHWRGQDTIQQVVNGATTNSSSSAASTLARAHALLAALSAAKEAPRAPPLRPGSSSGSGHSAAAVMPVAAFAEARDAAWLQRAAFDPTAPLAALVATRLRLNRENYAEAR